MPNPTAEIIIAFNGPIFFIKMYKIAPRKINSSNITDFMCHQRPSSTSFTSRRGLTSHRSFATYMRKKKPEAQQTDVTKKNKTISFTLSLVGKKPSTPRFFFSNNQINSHEIASCTMMPNIKFLMRRNKKDLYSGSCSPDNCENKTNHQENNCVIHKKLKMSFRKPWR